MACTNPYNVLIKQSATEQAHRIPVPCGKCPDCVGKRVSQWSFRLMQEGNRSESAVFLTLTYDPEYLPLSPNGYATLEKDAIPAFIKRLRHYHYERHGDRYPKIKYYAVGEYGSKRQRPHYHLILFNADLNDIEKSWTVGTKFYGDVCGPSIGYCLKYLSKQSSIGYAEGDDRLPTFATMSKRLGDNFLTESMVRHLLTDIDNRMYVLINGRKCTMPRYYKDKLFTDQYFESQELADVVRKVAGMTAKQRMDEETEKRIRYSKNYAHNKVERDKAKWQKMANNGNNDQIF